MPERGVFDTSIRAELDWLYVHFQDLERDELAYIVEAFASAPLSISPIARRKDKERWEEYWEKAGPH